MHCKRVRKTYLIPKCGNIKKTTRILIKSDDPGPPNSPPEITFSSLYLHTVLNTPISELLKNNSFLKHIHLTDLQPSCLKMTKKQQRGLRSIKAIKNHPKSKISIFRYTNDKFTSNKREKRGSRTPPIIFQNASQSSRDPARPRRPPGDPPKPLQGDHMSLFSDLIFNNEFRTLTCSRANF